MGTTHLFCPTMCFTLPDPDFCCHILYSIFIYCLLSIYTTVESSAICHFLQQFFKPLWLNPIFLLFQTVCSSPPPARPPPPSGDSFISHLPFLVLHGSPLSSVGFFLFVCLLAFLVFVLFFSLDFKIPPTAKAPPPFSARGVLCTLDTTQCWNLMAKLPPLKFLVGRARGFFSSFLSLFFFFWQISHASKITKGESSPEKLQVWSV